jgi:hypothetical protein
MPHKILIWQVAPGAYLRPLPERRLTTQTGGSRVARLTIQWGGGFNGEVNRVEINLGRNRSVP